MSWLPEELLLHHLVTFALVLVRVGTLALVAPVFGTVSAPVRVRLLLGLVLAALVTPVEWQKATAMPESLNRFFILAGSEALVGVSLGLGILILIASMHVAGQTISQMSGLQLADVFDPGFQTNTPIFTHLLLSVSTAVFVIIGGHRRVMEALLDTFVWLPVGQGGFSCTLVDAMVSLLSQSFVLGIRAAAPVMVSLLLATLILGLVSRSLPQLNLMALGFGFNALVALVAVGVSLGGAAWVFQAQFEPFLETVLSALEQK